MSYVTLDGICNRYKIDVEQKIKISLSDKRKLYTTSFLNEFDKLKKNKLLTVKDLLTSHKFSSSEFEINTSSLDAKGFTKFEVRQYIPFSIPKSHTFSFEVKLLDKQKVLDDSIEAFKKKKESYDWLIDSYGKKKEKELQRI